MPQTRPNILFIMADQMAASWMPIYNPSSPVRMPHLAKLAKDGVVFDAQALLREAEWYVQQEKARMAGGARAVP